MPHSAIVAPPVVGVAPAGPLLGDRAEALARRLRLPLVTPAETFTPLLLVITPERLELRPSARGAGGPVFVDFSGGGVGHRHRFGGGPGKDLARAVGVKKGVRPSILDATAGLGGDGFLLAAHGCTVTLAERSPVVTELLRDGMKRAMEDAEIGAIVRESMTLVEGDAREVMAELSGEARPDVVYVDPMHPPRGKSALVKKEMRTIRLAVGDDLDAPALLEAALACAQKRVVVKLPRRAKDLGRRPDFSQEGKSTRYDVYVTLKS